MLYTNNSTFQFVRNMLVDPADGVREILNNTLQVRVLLSNGNTDLAVRASNIYNGSISNRRKVIVVDEVAHMERRMHVGECHGVNELLLPLGVLLDDVKWIFVSVVGKGVSLWNM